MTKGFSKKEIELIRGALWSHELTAEVKLRHPNIHIHLVIDRMYGLGRAKLVLSKTLSNDYRLTTQDISMDVAMRLDDGDRSRCPKLHTPASAGGAVSIEAIRGTDTAGRITSRALGTANAAVFQYCLLVTLASAVRNLARARTVAIEQAILEIHRKANASRAELIRRVTYLEAELEAELALRAEPPITVEVASTNSSSIKSLFYEGDK